MSTEFPTSPTRFDPYKQFKFRVKWDGKYVAAVDKVSSLKRTTEVICHREGGDPSLQRRSPGQTSYEPIVLSRGRTEDLEFEQWANLVWKLQSFPAVALQEFRKDIVIDFVNEANERVMSYLVYRCWPSEYVALSDLDANSSSVAFESITLQHEGWERDTYVTEPIEG